MRKKKYIKQHTKQTDINKLLSSRQQEQMSLEAILEGDKGRAPTKLKWKGIPGRRATVGKCPLTSGHKLGVRDTKD